MGILWLQEDPFRPWRTRGTEAVEFIDNELQLRTHKRAEELQLQEDAKQRKAEEKGAKSASSMNAA